jgi:hypothetical protein
MEWTESLKSIFTTFQGRGGGSAFEALTTSRMARFNQETPDMEGTKYFSYGVFCFLWFDKGRFWRGRVAEGAEFKPSWSNVFRGPWGIVWEREGPNDGLVSVRSAMWGEYLGTLHDVNHLDLVGWVGRLRYAWADYTGKSIPFKPWVGPSPNLRRFTRDWFFGDRISFFLSIAEMLAHHDFWVFSLFIYQEI